jgi:hypothetical protein
VGCLEIFKMRIKMLFVSQIFLRANLRGSSNKNIKTHRIISKIANEENVLQAII